MKHVKHGKEVSLYYFFLFFFFSFVKQLVLEEIYSQGILIATVSRLTRDEFIKKRILEKMEESKQIQEKEQKEEEKEENRYKKI